VEEASTVCDGPNLSSGVVGALTVEASSPVCLRQQRYRMQRRCLWKRRLQSTTAPISAAVSLREVFLLVVSTAAVELSLCVCVLGCWVLLKDSVIIVEIQQGSLRN
jgi:hypothetical protein